jgi:glutaminyl-peptide cyclotransferase
MRKSVLAIAFIVLALVLTASLLTYLNNKSPSNSTSPTPTATPQPTFTLAPTITPIDYSYKIINTYPHDTAAFTEGLIYSGAYIYESTGLNGQSSIRRVDLATGNVLQEYSLPSQYFGEGITIVDNRIIQLTWQSNIGFIYDKNTLAVTGNFTYPTEGWGLTFNGTQLIMSDGTSNLYFLNSTTFQRIGQVYVHDGTSAVENINELEYVNGDVYANIWHLNKIAIINPENGQVKGWIDLAGLSAPPQTSDNVLNGIAYDQQNDRLFVTGKQWPNLYQITIKPVS